MKYFIIPAGCSKFEMQQMQLIQMVSELLDGLKRLEKKVDAILLGSEGQPRNQNEQTEDKNILEYLTTLPVASDEQFLDLNEKLKQDQNRKLIVSN